MALVAGRVHGNGILALHMRRPVAVEGLLHAVDVELSREFRADLAHYLEVLQAAGTDIDAAEELPVQVAVQAFEKFPVGTVRIVLQEHQGHLAPGGEDGLRAFFRLLQAEGRTMSSQGTARYILPRSDSRNRSKKAPNCSCCEENEKLCWKSWILRILDIVS